MLRSFVILAVAAVAQASGVAPAQRASEPLPPGLEEALRGALLEESFDLVRPPGAEGEGLPAGWRAPNPRRGMETRFGARGITVVPAESVQGSWSFALTLSGYGRSGEVRPVREAELVALGNRAEYRRGALVEWYVNDARGLEQGFTLLEPPQPGGARDGGRPLELRLELATDLVPEPGSDGRAVRFRDAQGRAVLHYAGLAAWDATGRELAALLRVEGQELRIQVDDEAAVYPLTVDPLCFVEQAKLTASDGWAFDYFGYSVSLSGDTALVGAHGDDDNGTDSGSAYVFVRSGTSWTQEAKLIAGDGAAADIFGHSVSLSGDTALVGAQYDNDTGSNSGSAYVFVRQGTGWTQQAKLVAGDGAADDEFGTSVSLSGDTALVGAALDDDNGSWSGSAYVFVRSGTSWTQEAKLLAGDGAAGDYFGYSVSLSGDTALVCAALDNDNGINSGSAYVFARSGTSWTQEAKLLAGHGAADDWFGWSVSVSGDMALVGAYGDDDNGSDSGSAYVFVRSGTSWTQEAKLLAGDGAWGDRFGGSVSLSGDTALVGARYDDDNGGASGSAYVFARSGTSWTQTAKLLASGGAANDYFGWSVFLSGDTALVGAYWDDDNGTASGSANVFAPPPPSGSAYCTCPVGPCGNSDPGAGCTNATGVGAEFTAQGTTLPDEVNLLVARASPGQFAIFFQGDDAVMLPFGDGFRCAGGNVVRITVPPLVIGPDGTAAFGPCFGDPTISSITGVVPGSGVTKRYQLWYRDPFGPCGTGFNLSNGYAIVW